MCSSSLFWNNRHALGRSQVPVAPYAIHAHPREAHTPQSIRGPRSEHTVSQAALLSPQPAAEGEVPPSPREAEEPSSVTDVRTRQG